MRAVVDVRVKRNGNNLNVATRAKRNDLCATVSSEHLTEKRPVLIRPLVLKVPIDFHRGGWWASDLIGFLALTKAKLSHLKTWFVFRDSVLSTDSHKQFISIRWNFSRAAEFHHNEAADKDLSTSFSSVQSLGLTPSLYYSSTLDNDTSDPTTALCAQTQ